MGVSATAVWRARIELDSERATVALAEALCPMLSAGDVLLLEGQIGAGKTFFARALITALLRDFGTPEDIPSPTFTLIQTYDAGDLEIWHSDLYRLSHIEEVEELGLLDAFHAALCLVEWPDRLGPETPGTALRLGFELGRKHGARAVEISVSDSKWNWLKPILSDNFGWHE